MLTPSRQLTDAEKLRKVILELVDTERAYVKVIYHFIYANFILNWIECQLILIINTMQ